MSDSRKLMQSGFELTHFLFPKETGEKLRDRETHVFR